MSLGAEDRQAESHTLPSLDTIGSDESATMTYLPSP